MSGMLTNTQTLGALARTYTQSSTDDTRSTIKAGDKHTCMQALRREPLRAGGGQSSSSPLNIVNILPSSASLPPPSPSCIIRGADRHTETHCCKHPDAYQRSPCHLLLLPDQTRSAGPGCSERPLSFSPAPSDSCAWSCRAACPWVCPCHYGDGA